MDVMYDGQNQEEPEMMNTDEPGEVTTNKSMGPVGTTPDAMPAGCTAPSITTLREPIPDFPCNRGIYHTHKLHIMEIV